MKDASTARSDPRSTSAISVTDSERTTLDWPRHAGTTEAVLQELAVQLLYRRRRRRQRGALAGLVLLVAGAWFWQAPTSSIAPAVASAMASLPARNELPDGSVVLLRSGAEISINFSDTARRVQLIQGEALFDVAKNAERPFIVRAAGVDVRALGTTFAVILQDAAVEVLVTEGQVEVERELNEDAETRRLGAAETESRGQPTEDREQSFVPRPPSFALPLSSSRWTLDAGKRIVVEFAKTMTTPQVEPVSELEIHERLSWRIPKLHFARTPLRDAVAMINQHSRTQLILDGTTQDNVPLSGVIRADNIDALLELLESEYGIKAEHRGDTNVVLRKSP